MGADGVSRSSQRVTSGGGGGRRQRSAANQINSRARRRGGGIFKKHKCERLATAAAASLSCASSLVSIDTKTLLAAAPRQTSPQRSSPASWLPPIRATPRFTVTSSWDCLPLARLAGERSRARARQRQGELGRAARRPAAAAAAAAQRNATQPNDDIPAEEHGWAAGRVYRRATEAS
jgi:hypothetical protein